MTPDAALADACFVEDAAVVLNEVAIIAQPGVASRRAELAKVGSMLAQYREVKRIELPACQVIKVAGGKIESFTQYFDMVTLLTQIGAFKG